MRTIVTFGMPADVGEKDLDRVVLLFPLTVRRIRDGAKIDGNPAIQFP